MKFIWLTIYNIFLYPIFFLLAIILFPFNTKIRLGIQGRYRSLSRLRRFKQSNSFSEIYWFHVSSFGEFQQIESIIDDIKKSNNNAGILVSFFSPSGYKNVNSDRIDCKIYLPFDFPFSVFRCLSVIKPKKMIFASYDVWPNVLIVARYLGIETMLISARVHDKSLKLKMPTKSIYRSIYGMIDKIFTVNNKDLENLKLIIPSKKIEAMGNPRFDIAIKKGSNVDIKFDMNYKSENKIFLFASLWPQDDSILFPKIFDLLNHNNAKIVLIPHELSDKSINYYQKQATKNNISSIVIDSYINLSELKERVVIVNAVGMLYKLYWQAYISYVGGGFSRNGIHNIMEPAVASNPIIFGPNYSNGNFFEAEQLLSASSAFTTNSSENLMEVLSMLNDDIMYESASKSSRFVMEENRGSTDRLLSRIVR